MAKTWILDTETKGTGAHMVPLEKALKKGGPEPELNLIELRRAVAPKPAPEQTAPSPLRFKLVDIMTRETLAEDVDARATVAVLERVHSIVDVQLYVWSSADASWRMLTLDERRTMWAFRGAQSS